MDLNRVFVGSKMNKSLDERLLPNGQYTDALNIRVSSDEDGEAGSVENAKGNELVATLSYNGSSLTNAKCIGAYEFSANETIFWFVTSDEVDMIVSFDANTSSIRYHVVSTSVLNFSPDHLVNGVDLIDDLLFFTDNFNQPRRININQSYPLPISGVDAIVEDDISVIVKAPISSPNIQLVTSPTDNNYMEDKFIRFAYRYKYRNGEYSALSQFSEVAFVAGSFSVDLNNYIQEGMSNVANAVNISINTGPSQVVGIDLCFKLSHTNVIHVIERFDKADKNWGDESEVFIEFNNQKIYTTLPQDELLRRFDNVPRLAKAQTSMGNRVFFGNYVDGYDIDTFINYDLELVSEEVGFRDVPVDYSVGSYDIESPTDIEDSVLNIDLTGVDLVKGSRLSIDINIVHDSFVDSSGNYVDGNEPRNSYDETMQFILPRDYNSVIDLVSDSSFSSYILSSLPFSDASNGYSLTDLFYNNITSNSGWTKVGGGVASDSGDFVISANGNVLNIQIPAIKFEDDSNQGVFAYEYFKNATTTAGFSSIASPSSLHSDRDYEVGIEYMDEYNRSSTVLVNQGNTIFVPPNRSTFKNDIKVSINNTPPSWAKRYRLLMKPTKQGHDTIYTNFYYFDSTDNGWWFLLEGDNQTKCKVGDTLFVKSDSNGATSSRIKVKVLDIDSKERNFISEDILSPPGVYMKLRKAGFDVSDLSEEAPIAYPQKSGKGSYPIVYYPAFIEDTTAPNGAAEYAVPAGSKVKIRIRDVRGGRRSSCGSRRYLYEEELLATRSYDNLYDFLVGENFNPSDPTNNPDIDSSDDSTPTMVWDPDIKSFSEHLSANFSTSTKPLFVTGQPGRENAVCNIFYARGEVGSSAEGYAFLGARSGNDRCNWRRGKVYVRLEVYSAGDVLIFETEPEDYTNDIFFEGHNSYPIENGFHTGSVQNQDANTPAVSMLDMHNCYSFGNGAESMKINDELDGFSLTIGDRVSAVSNQEYRRIRRYSDITYSGVYNDESNINGLNEFNLALGNFKTMERNFGSIEVLHSRETNILVLQEDRISYVLQGKNILSDAAGGSSLTSIPEVLGTQVPFVEELGISNNPESFSVYGSDVFFTDAKRGVVLRVTSGNQIDIISNKNMRSFFRDEFINNVNNIKIGGYDPFSDEYVLSIKDDTLPISKAVFDCGFNISQQGSSTISEYTVDLGDNVGDVDIDYNVSSGSVLVNVNYNGLTTINQTVTGSGVLSFSKDVLEITNAEVTITPTNATYNINIGCPDFVPLNIIRIVKNTEDMIGEEIHHSYTWQNGNYVSNTQTDLVSFGNGPVSLYLSSTLSSNTPPIGSTITMRYEKRPGDTADWIGDKFKYLVSDTLYTESQINALTPLLQESTPVVNVGNGIYESTFTYNNPTGAQYLYLVWDYIEPAIECNGNLFTHGKYSIKEFDVNLGSNIGPAEFTFDMGDIPSRAEVIWDGNVVADSLFVGDGLPNVNYENNITSATSLEKHVFNGNFVFQNNEAVNFTSSDISDYNTNRPTTNDGSVGNQVGVVSGYPSGTPLASAGDIKLMFNKTAPTPTKATIRFTTIGASNNTNLTDVSCPVLSEAVFQEVKEFYTQTWEWTPNANDDIAQSNTVVVASIDKETYLWIDDLKNLGNPIMLSTSDTFGSNMSVLESNFESIVEGTIVSKKDYKSISKEEYFIK